MIDETIDDVLLLSLPDPVCQLPTPQIAFSHLEGAINTGESKENHSTTQKPSSTSINTILEGLPAEEPSHISDTVVDKDDISHVTGANLPAEQPSHISETIVDKDDISNDKGSKENSDYEEVSAYSKKLTTPNTERSNQTAMNLFLTFLFRKVDIQKNGERHARLLELARVMGMDHH